MTIGAADGVKHREIRIEPVDTLTNDSRLPGDMSQPKLTSVPTHL